MVTADMAESDVLALKGSQQALGRRAVERAINDTANMEA